MENYNDFTRKSQRLTTELNDALSAILKTMGSFGHVSINHRVSNTIYTISMVSDNGGKHQVVVCCEKIGYQMRREFDLDTGLISAVLCFYNLVTTGQDPAESLPTSQPNVTDKTKYISPLTNYGLSTGFRLMSVIRSVVGVLWPTLEEQSKHLNEILNNLDVMSRFGNDPLARLSFDQISELLALLWARPRVYIDDEPAKMFLKLKNYPTVGGLCMNLRTMYEGQHKTIPPNELSEDIIRLTLMHSLDDQGRIHKFDMYYICDSFGVDVEIEEPTTTPVPILELKYHPSMTSTGIWSKMGDHALNHSAGPLPYAIFDVVDAAMPVEHTHDSSAHLTIREVRQVANKLGFNLTVPDKVVITTTQDPSILTVWRLSEEIEKKIPGFELSDIHRIVVKYMGIPEDNPIGGSCVRFFPRLIDLLEESLNLKIVFVKEETPVVEPDPKVKATGRKRTKEFPPTITVTELAKKLSMEPEMVKHYFFQVRGLALKDDSILTYDQVATYVKAHHNLTPRRKRVLPVKARGN